MKPFCKFILAGSMTLLLSNAAQSARVEQKLSDAPLVVEGKIIKITSKGTKFQKDGVWTTYTVELNVKKVVKGKYKGETLKVLCGHVSKAPSNPVPGDNGIRYKIKKGDEIRVYVEPIAKTKRYTVIHNTKAIEKID
jgi:hypothetical protein